ncbi:MAG: ComEA family DNA-binding protein [Clostridiales bacterium]
MNQLQRIGLTGMTILLLIGFWAGLWYQGQRKGGAVVLAAAGEELADGLNGEPAAEGEAARDQEAVAGWPEGLAGLAAGETVSGKGRQPKAMVNLKDGEATEGSELASAGFGSAAFGTAGPGIAADGSDLPEPGGQAGLPAYGEGDMAVHVVGKVASPGLYFLPPGSRIYDAVMLAEPERDADLGRINLALPLEDGMQIRVPVIGKPSAWEDDALIVRADDNNYELWQENGQSQTAAKGKININKATAAELETLPGIGPAYSRRIIQYREEKGGFRTAEDLLKVKGIGRAKMEELKDLVCCS